MYCAKRLSKVKSEDSHMRKCIALKYLSEFHISTSYLYILQTLIACEKSRFNTQNTLKALTFKLIVMIM